MRSLRLGFRALDPHELLVHFVAESAGLYAERDLNVELVDLRRGDQPYDATCACGSALFEAIDGAGVQILLIASAAPLFWLYGPTHNLAGARIATYPPAAPPARFLELALEEPAELVAAPDDAARLALVREGLADCALLSSATPAARVGPNLRPLFCLAERVRVPSTGLAVASARAPELTPLVMVHRQALRRIRSARALAERVVCQNFEYTAFEAAWLLDHVRRHFSADGRVPLAYLTAALATVKADSSPYAASSTKDAASP